MRQLVDVGQTIKESENGVRGMEGRGEGEKKKQLRFFSGTRFIGGNMMYVRRSSTRALLIILALA